MKTAAIILVILSLSLDAAQAQIGLSSPTPTYQSFTPIVGPQSTASASIQYQSPIREVRLGGNAQQISSYRQPGYHQISQSEQQREIAELVSEMQGTQLKQPKSFKTSSVSPQQLADAKALTERYYKALGVLSEMLDGKTPVSVSHAFYTIESAFGKPYLSESEFHTEINRSAAFIKKWMQQEHLDPHDNDVLNLAIQKFMGEPLNVFRAKQELVRTPIKLTTSRRSKLTTLFAGEDKRLKHVIVGG